MSNIPLKTITFPGLNDKYTIPQVDSTLAVTGAAADAKKTGDEIGDLKEALTTVSTTLATKADKLGTVASAEQLLSDVGTEDKAPYLFRATPYDSTRVDEEVVGCSVGWNQLVGSDTSSVTVANGHKLYTVIGGSASIVASDGTAISVTGGTDMVIDLTAWFGTAIADYAYTLEQATAGSGVAWIKALLPGGYIPYSAPKLESVSGLSAHVMRDADENIIGNYPLDSDLTLRGILKMDSDHRVYANGDRYLPDGAVERRYVLYNAGNLNWTYNASSLIGSPCFYSNTIGSKKAGSSNFILPGYVTKSDRNAIDGNMQIAPGNTTDAQYVVLTNTSYTNPDDLKTSLDNVYWLCELATPTTETADPFTSPQNCAVGGTEEYVYAEGGSGVPVGHNSKYQKNMRSELERVSVAVPEVGSTAGTYVLKATVTAQGVTYGWVAE